MLLYVQLSKFYSWLCGRTVSGNLFLDMKNLLGV